ncbi:uncharacterized protein N7498_001909 [Penicillium cinerascens]|uniref:Uncharacterized protein n=1 Tax=Penicillium cinerascens TaxID=70096 RepID=A0A9W9N931_9EURO|nr:uncharacterized protein N7498_001909 [Penicillium cinerascens]KAJ5215502.1 hypothetical protein N7498_001909 [Penicillium cinerascens]
MDPTERDTFIHKIFAKITQLQSIGLIKDDKDIIERNRLSLIWLEATSDSTPSSTKWRHSRSREKYREIEDVSSHLFLALVLTIPPSVCYTPNFQPVINYLVGLGDYKGFQFFLGLKEKEFFESVAVEQGYAGSPLYLDFMRTIFPGPESRRK